VCLQDVVFIPIPLSHFVCCLLLSGSDICIHILHFFRRISFCCSIQWPIYSVVMTQYLLTLSYSIVLHYFWPLWWSHCWPLYSIGNPCCCWKSHSDVLTVDAVFGLYSAVCVWLADSACVLLFLSASAIVSEMYCVISVIYVCRPAYSTYYSMYVIIHCLFYSVLFIVMFNLVIPNVIIDVEKLLIHWYIQVNVFDYSMYPIILILIIIDYWRIVDMTDLFWLISTMMTFIWSMKLWHCGSSIRGEETHSNQM